MKQDLLKAIQVERAPVQRLYMFAICVPLFYPIFNYFWMLSFEHLALPGAATLDTSLFVLEAGVLIAASAFSLIESPQRVILPYSILFLLVTLSLIANPETLPFLRESSQRLLAFCVPMLFLVPNIRDYGRLLRVLFGASYVVGTMGLFVALLMPKSTYSMWYSDALLPALIFITVKQFVRYRLHDTLLIVAMLFSIFAYGSRGALLCFAVACILLLVWKLRVSQRVLMGHSDLAQASIAVGLGTLIAVALFAQSWTGSSRLLATIRTGGLFYDSGRSEIYRAVLELIGKHPFGTGLHGERALLTGNGEQWYEGSYAHNVLLELVVHIGIIPGLVAFAALGAAVVTFLIHNPNPHLLLLLIGSFSIGFIQSLYSGTYLTNPGLWLFLAVTISGNTRREKGLA